MNMPVESGAGPKAGRREWIGLAVLALPTLLLSVDMSVLYLALPHLSADLHASAVQQLWVIDIYSFMTAGFLVTMGTLGDRIGRRRLLMIGAVVFGAASLVAAYSNSPGMLIATRAIIGIAAATILPSALGLVRNMFQSPKDMGKAMGIWFSCFLGGQAIGPLVGGLLLDNFWWGSVFLMGVPVMVLVLIFSPIYLPESRHTMGGKLDLISVALSLAAILPIIYGLKDAANNGWSATAVVTIVVGVIIGAVFLRRQNKLQTPLLDLSLFRNKTFSTSLAVMLLAGVVMAGIVLLSAIYLQTVKGYSPLDAGLLLLPQNVAMVIGSMTAPMIASKFRASYVMAGGLLISAIGLVIVMTISGTSATPLLVVGLVLTLGGISLPMVMTGNLVMGSQPMEKAGAAAGIMETSGEFGVAVGVAVMGSLAALVYRNTLPSIPGVPDAASHASITSAAVTAAKLPAVLGNELMTAARTAFAHGFDTVAGVGAAIFVILTIVSAIVIRKSDQPAGFGGPGGPGGAPGGAPDGVPAGEAAGAQIPVSANAED
jgi:DHA2 family multidrug resistance protein-like MFS transporter